MFKIKNVYHDPCYYLNQITNEPMSKYFVVLSLAPCGGDAIICVFTSRPNGLTDSPECTMGPPRAGFYLGIPGGLLPKETWADFSSVEVIDIFDLKKRQITNINQPLDDDTFCSLLRCIFQCEDIKHRDLRLIGDTIAQLNCP